MIGEINALNERGLFLLNFILEKSKKEKFSTSSTKDSLIITLKEDSVNISDEEHRSKRPSAFSIVRFLKNCFSSDSDPQLGLYGAFGYDLTFNFEEIQLHQNRSESQRDVVLFLPDKIFVHDQALRAAWELSYDFSFEDSSTIGLPRVNGISSSYVPDEKAKSHRDHRPGEYSESVEEARREFACGNLFECVLSQTFIEPCLQSPSKVYANLKKRNPSPYMFLLNLGEQEWLVGASPEMFVRVESTDKGLRVETCPISGTIARGKDAVEDATRIQTILSDPKEESELTMCTDVDRNDKSRICEPGSVKVIGRRQIELYSRLIHTVDHVEGILRPEFDALDAFLVHTWAVTVTGAPKPWAIQFVEKKEKSPREWYGGAVGLVGFDGHLNTGMTLRTIRMFQGKAQIRAGATLLFDSIPEKEEAETELKASRF